eukprot:1150264-Pelagomonas_calceolata.AAC.1
MARCQKDLPASAERKLLHSKLACLAGQSPLTLKRTNPHLHPVAMCQPRIKTFTTPSCKQPGQYYYQLEVATSSFAFAWIG